ncbi:MAG: hypothetical protein ACXVDV_20190 [Bacteroidia bacterium]
MPIKVFEYQFDEHHAPILVLFLEADIFLQRISEIMQPLITFNTIVVSNSQDQTNDETQLPLDFAIQDQLSKLSNFKNKVIVEVRSNNYKNVKLFNHEKQLFIFANDLSWVGEPLKKMLDNYRTAPEVSEFQASEQPIKSNSKCAKFANPAEGTHYIQIGVDSNRYEEKDYLKNVAGRIRENAYIMTGYLKYMERNSG